MQNHAQRSDALDYIFAKRPLRSVGKEMERPMTAPENRAVTVLVTKEHVRRMIEYHLLKEDEISDPVKLSQWCESRWTPPWGFRTRDGMSGERAYVTAASTLACFTYDLANTGHSRVPRGRSIKARV